MAAGIRAKKVMDRQVYIDGQVIFREGKPGAAAYVVQEGKVEIFKHIGDTEVVLGRIEPGGLFGEMALIDDKPRMASARAVSRTVLIGITRTQLSQKLDKSDSLVRAILRILLGNHRQMARRLAMAESKLKENGISMDE